MNEPPLLLHVFPSFAVGGAQVRFAALANRYGARWRHAVVALDGETGCAARLSHHVPFELLPAPAPRGAGFPRRIMGIRRMLRRLRPALSGGNLDYAGISMDTSAHKVTRDGSTVSLGPTEFRLLRHFLEHPGRVFSREQLLDAVWGRDVYVEQRTVDVHIRRLRKAVNAADNGTELPDVIRTVRSAGYALDAAPLPA